MFKKHHLILLLVLISLTILNVNAETFKGYITGENVGFRPCPSADSSVCPRIDSLFLTEGHYVIMENKDLVEGYGCSDGWYKGTYNDKIGYVCSSYVGFREEYNPLDPSAYATYKEYLLASGFETGYADKLAQLHEKYPNWEFQPILTNINWSSLVSSQSIGGRSCTYSSNQGLYSTEPGVYDYLTDKFYSVDAGCYATNQETTAFYLDPRNWLVERTIFMFENLSNNPTIHNEAVIASIIGSNPYVPYFYNAGIQYVCDLDYDNAGSYASPTTCVNAASNLSEPAALVSISPVHLASRSRQEIGTISDSNVRINGLYSLKYCDYSLTGYYNFYNIGSFIDKCTPPNSPTTRGMAYACGPNCEFNSTYGRPWNTIQKGINGGAQFIYKNYFTKGQDTIYFQKFNTSGISIPYTNQYMQNVAAPSSESGITYNAYNNNALLNNNIKFKIPVYLSMPVSTQLPTSGNPNNHLNKIAINGNLIDGFSHDIYEYNLNLLAGTPSILLEATQINAKAIVEGIGQIMINKDTKYLIIKVTAENKSTLEYKININFQGDLSLVMSPEEMITNSGIKSDGKYIIDVKEGQQVTDLVNILLKTNINSIVKVIDANGKDKTTSLFTGDVLVITSKEITTKYPVVVIGDGSGDGKISIADLLKVQKHILKVSNASGPYLKAIDVNRDGQITIVDLLKVQKHILNVSNIE